MNEAVHGGVCHWFKMRACLCVLIVLSMHSFGHNAVKHCDHTRLCWRYGGVIVLDIVRFEEH